MSYARRRAVDVRLELAPDIAISQMRSDPIKLRQVLTNLLSNAVKSCERGAITLRVERDAKDRVSFCVTDTGIGIPSSQPTRIFEPFRQLQGRGTPAEGGAGLGLAIASRLCELLGGSVSVESRVGEGSQFTVRLPLNAEGLRGQHSSLG